MSPEDGNCGDANIGVANSSISKKVRITFFFDFFHRITKNAFLLFFFFICLLVFFMRKECDELSMVEKKDGESVVCMKSVFNCKWEK